MDRYTVQLSADQRPLIAFVINLRLIHHSQPSSCISLQATENALQIGHYFLSWQVLTLSLDRLSIVDNFTHNQKVKGVGPPGFGIASGEV